MPLQPQDLEEFGQALWGDQWIGPMSNHLNVDDRRLRRMMVGEVPIPPGFEQELMDLARTRGEKLMLLAQGIGGPGGGMQTTVYPNMRRPGEFRRR